MEIVKYFTFMIGSVLVIGITILWLKANRQRRAIESKKNDNLEVQKYRHKQLIAAQKKSSKNE